MDIFPAFDEFLPHFSFQPPISTFFHNFMQNSEKNFVCTIFPRNFVWKGKIFGASSHLRDAMKIFTVVGKKKQGRNWHVFDFGGGKNGNFWPTYLPLFKLVLYIVSMNSLSISTDCILFHNLWIPFYEKGKNEWMNEKLAISWKSLPAKLSTFKVVIIALSLTTLTLLLFTFWFFLFSDNVEDIVPTIFLWKIQKKIHIYIRLKFSQDIFN